MRAVVQRARDASVTVDGEVVGKIAKGMVVLLGVALGDSEAHAAMLARKIAALRLFPDLPSALRSFRGLLVAGGRLSVAVWGRPLADPAQVRLAVQEAGFEVTHYEVVEVDAHPRSSRSSARAWLSREATVPRGMPSAVAAVS